jgi:putative ABC transport system permease protein
MKGKIYFILRVIKIGIKNITLHKLRSLLTILGVVFGVASVIAMLAIGEGASYEAREKIKELGSQNIIIRSVQPPETRATQEATTMIGVYGLVEKDYEMIKTIPSVDLIVPTWEMKEEIRYMEKNVQGRIVCTYPEYKDVMNIGVEAGRFFTNVDMELFKPYAVIGYSIKKSLFPAEDPIGKTITIRNYNFKVIGIAKEKSLITGTTGFVAEDVNFDIYIPFTTGRAYFGEFEITSKQGPIMRWQRNWVKYHRFIVRVNDTDKILTTSGIIESILKTNHKKDDYEFLVPLQLLLQAEHTKRIFNIVLGSIAAISLIVGGIGIMNIMLATVTERTREIGIRRAVGAKRKDIISQFLLETVILSSTGGFMGIILGILIPKLVTKFAGMTTVITWWSIVLSFSISVGVGITFGIYPARKAAYLDPIQALRYE